VTHSIAKLDIAAEVQKWFSISRLRIPNRIRADLRSSNKQPRSNSALIWLFAETAYSSDIRCHLAVVGGDSMDPTIAVKLKAIGPDGTNNAYGSLEYIVHDMKAKRGLKDAIRCEDVLIHDSAHLRTTLDNCLDDFIALTSDG